MEWLANILNDINNIIDDIIINDIILGASIVYPDY